MVLGLSTLIRCGSFSLRPACSTTFCLRSGLTTSARMSSYAVNSPIRRAGLSPTLMLASPAHGPKARHVIAWAGASNASGGPGAGPRNSPLPCKRAFPNSLVRHEENKGILQCFGRFTPKRVTPVVVLIGEAMMVVKHLLKGPELLTGQRCLLRGKRSKSGVDC